MFLPRQREGWREIVESVAFLDIFTAGFDFRTFLSAEIRDGRILHSRLSSLYPSDDPLLLSISVCITSAKNGVGVANAKKNERLNERMIYLRTSEVVLIPHTTRRMTSGKRHFETDISSQPGLLNV